MNDPQQPGRPGPGDDPAAATPQPDPRTPPPPPAPPRRLLRSRHDRLLAGVAGGLAAHLSVDPLLVRIAFVVLSFTGGAGLLLYAAGWLAIPAQGEAEAVGVTLLRRVSRGGWRAYLLLALVAVATAVILSDLDPGHPGLLWGLLLLGLGGALLIRESDLPPPPSSPASSASAWPPSAPPPPPAPSWPPPPPPPGGAARAGGWAPWPPRPRRRSAITRITVVAALLAAAATGLAADAGVPGITAQTALAVVLTVIGLGLAVGAWCGAPRGLVVLGALLVPVVLASGGLSGVSLRGGAGDRSWSPHSVGDLRSAQHLGAGTLTVDLTGVAFGPGAAAVQADVGMGQLDVLVPPDVPIEVHARVGAGQALLLGHEDDGLQVDTRVHEAGSPQVGRLSLDLRAGLGQVRVRRAPVTTQGA